MTGVAGGSADGITKQSHNPLCSLIQPLSSPQEGDLPPQSFKSKQQAKASWMSCTFSGK